MPAELLNQLPSGLQRLPRADLHVTLAFLGAVGEANAWAAWRAAPSLPAGGFEVRARAWQALGRPDRPSAYGLVVDDDRASLHDWMARNRDVVRAAAGLEAAPGAALPHVTLARPPRRGGTTIRQRAAHWFAAAEVPDLVLRLDRLALYTWSQARPVRLFHRVSECRAG